MARRLLLVATASLVVLVLAAGPALACGGLVSANGTIALVRTTTPAASPKAAQVLLQKSIDSLDITILKGGGYAVGTWARDHGFQLTPDAPEVLDFYASRSPIFMAVQFNAKRAAARGERIGDAIPI